MENHRCEQIYEVLLSMNINCCERCPRILERKLRKMPGVDEFCFVEKDLIKVIGTIEPETLLNNVRKLGKRVEMVPMEEELNKRPKKYTQPRGKRVYEEPPHKCEDYEAPGMNPRVCRDILCKTHLRSHPISGNKLEDASLPIFGFGPFFNGPSSMSFSGYQQPYPPQYGPPQQFWRPY